MGTGRKLSARQARFVTEYLIDLRAAAAAQRAGYSAKTAQTCGPRLLTFAHVKEAIAKAQETRMTRTEITAARVLGELGLLAFSDIDNYMVDMETGKLTAAPGAPAGAMRAVSSVKYRTLTYDDGSIERTVEFKLWDKPGTLKLAGRHVGLFPSKDTDQIKAAAFEMLQDEINKARRARETAGAAPAPAAAGKMIDVPEAPKP